MNRFLNYILPRMAVLLVLSVLASVFLITESTQAGWPGSTFRLTVDVSPGQGGDIQVDSVIPDSYPVTLSHASGATLELTAIPAPGYTFVEWSGDVNGNSESTTLIINCDTTATAIFSSAQSTSGWWWLVAGIGAIIATLPIYLLFTRKPTVSEE